MLFWIVAVCDGQDRKRKIQVKRNDPIRDVKCSVFSVSGFCVHNQSSSLIVEFDLRPEILFQLLSPRFLDFTTTLDIIFNFSNFGWLHIILTVDVRTTCTRIGKKLKRNGPFYCASILIGLDFDPYLFFLNFSEGNFKVHSMLWPKIQGNPLLILQEDAEMLYICKVTYIQHLLVLSVRYTTSTTVQSNQKIN